MPDWFWTVFIAVGAVGAFFSRRKTNLEKAIRRRLEPQLSRAPAPILGGFPPSGVVPTCLVVLSRICLSTFGGVDTYRSWVVVYGTTSLEYLLAASALILHWADPLGKQRWVKYDLVLGALILRSSVLVHTQMLRDEHTAAASDVCTITAAMAVLMASWLVAVATRPFTNGDSGYWAVLRLNRWAERGGRFFVPLVLGIVPFMAPIFLVLLLLRYHLRPLLEQHPILYLRPFRSEHAQFAFASVVAPTASRYGVLTGLVGARQTADVLHRHVSIFHRGLFLAVPDDLWKDWVTKALAKCHAAIIDMSVRSENLNWELKQAIRAVGRSRVALLVSADVGAPRDGDLNVIEYPSSRKGIKGARRALQLWLEASLIVSPEDLDAAAALRRELNFVVGWLVMLACLITLGGYVLIIPGEPTRLFLQEFFLPAAWKLWGGIGLVAGGLKWAQPRFRRARAGVMR